MSDGFFQKWKKGIEEATLEQQYQAAYRGNIVNCVAGLGVGGYAYFLTEWNVAIGIVLFVFGVWQGYVAFQNYKTYKAMINDLDEFKRLSG